MLALLTISLISSLDSWSGCRSLGTLLRCLKKLEHGDTFIVWKLDRLGRSLRDLITMLDDLKRRRMKFVPHRGNRH